MEIIITLFTLFIAFIITHISIPSIIKVSIEKRLFDEPDGLRKTHSRRVPTLGGIAIFAGVLIGSVLVINFRQDSNLAYVFAAFTVLFFTGVKDDIIPLSPGKKLAAQILAALIIVLRCDIRLSNMYGILGVEEISYFWSVLISLFFLLAIINAFNLIDGINGLAGGISGIVSSSFGILFFMMGEYNFAYLSFALFGASLSFLWYNYRNQIFMGDTGSLTIGLILGVFSIQFIELNHTSGFLFTPTFAPVLVFAILIIPIFDTMRVMCIRLFKRKPLFTGDQNHLHHFLTYIGFSHIQAAGVLCVTNLLFILVACLGQTLPQLLLLSCLLSLALILSATLYYFKTRKELESMNHGNSYHHSSSKRVLQREYTK